jgi:hypothetical protein
MHAIWFYIFIEWNGVTRSRLHNWVLLVMCVPWFRWIFLGILGFLVHCCCSYLLLGVPLYYMSHWSTWCSVGRVRWLVVCAGACMVLWSRWLINTYLCLYLLLIGVLFVVLGFVPLFPVRYSLCVCCNKGFHLACILVLFRCVFVARIGRSCECWPVRGSKGEWVSKKLYWRYVTRSMFCVLVM